MTSKLASLFPPTDAVRCFRGSIGSLCGGCSVERDGLQWRLDSLDTHDLGPCSLLIPMTGQALVSATESERKRKERERRRRRRQRTNPVRFLIIGVCVEVRLTSLFHIHVFKFTCESSGIHNTRSSLPNLLSIHSSSLTCLSADSGPIRLEATHIRCVNL